MHCRIRGVRPTEFEILHEQVDEGVDTNERDHRVNVSSQSNWPTGSTIQGPKPARARIANFRFNWEDGAYTLAHSVHFDPDVQSWPAWTTGAISHDPMIIIVSGVTRRGRVVS